MKQSRDVYGDKDETKKRHIDQILGAWGEFGSLTTLPAGRGATIGFRFRNGKQVHFEAHEILFTKLLKDVKEYISSAPKQLDWQKTDISDVGTRLVAMDQNQYVGRSVARWDLDLEPRPLHFDRQINVATPLQKAGAYLLTARMEGGNTTRIVVWLDDTVILQKPLDGAAYYFIADARTGRRHRRRQRRLLRVASTTSSRQERAAHRDQDARAHVRRRRPASGSQPPSSPTRRGTSSGSLPPPRPRAGSPILGFTNIWAYGRHDSAYDQEKIYTITDRPVYRPGTPVRFKFWLARSRYDQPETTDFAGKSFPVEIHDPKGDKIFTKSFTTDRFGGFDGSFELPSDAALGVYNVFIPRRGGVSFRVEEYKKPEFEVSVAAPTVPVMLGEKVAATIKASYYFGGPVAQAKVKYKITRSTSDDRWYPSGRWDWLFGPGYWWFAADSPWYPGWANWGMEPPARLVVGPPASSPRGRGRRRIAHPPRRNPSRRDRHRAREGRPSRSRPPIRDQSRDHRSIAQDDPRHGNRAGRPQALQGLHLGRSRPLPHRRCD